ncbi:MAG: CPBP family intramembrane metalloprotease [Planctomycetaceae bacterium]|nr:CPBP family intramembrane metalloprotease [Planctomycetaceae bacterium]
MSIFEVFFIPPCPDTKLSLGYHFLASYKIWGSFFLFGLIPILMIKYYFQEKLSNYGLQLGNVKRGLGFFLCMIPVMAGCAYFAGTNPKFHAVYPYNRLLTGHDSFFVFHAVLYPAYYFGWEFFFRGFLQNGLRKTIGLGNAILFQSLASTMLHFGHPGIEVYASLFAGMFWGIIAHRVRSVWSGVLQHSLLGILLDWFLLQTQSGKNFPSA